MKYKIVKTDIFEGLNQRNEILIKRNADMFLTNERLKRMNAAMDEHSKKQAEIIQNLHTEIGNMKIAAAEIQEGTIKRLNNEIDSWIVTVENRDRVIIQLTEEIKKLKDNERDNHGRLLKNKHVKKTSK